MLAYDNQPHADLATSYENLGLVCKKQHHYVKAEEFYQQALKLWERCAGTQHPAAQMVKQALTQLAKLQKPLEQAARCEYAGELCLSQKDYKQALYCYAKALQLYRSVYGTAPHMAIMESYSALGRICAMQGAGERAIQCYEQALRLSKALYTPHQPHLGIATIHSCLGMRYMARKAYAKAVTHHAQALQIRTAVYGDEPHLAIAKSCLSLATAYHKQKRYANAAVYYRAALAMFARCKQATGPLAQTARRKLAEVAALCPKQPQE